MHHRKRSDKQSAIESKAKWAKACRALTGAVLLSTAAVLSAGSTASAQNPPPPDKTAVVSLIAQDFSDCTNTTVKDDPNRIRGGLIKVSRHSDTTTVMVAMTANATTTYHFFLKCVRILGDIVTDGEGVGNAVFTFPNALAGPVFSFDMYPEGAPAGNKFQSMTTDLR